MLMGRANKPVEANLDSNRLLQQRVEHRVHPLIKAGHQKREAILQRQLQLLQEVPVRLALDAPV